MQVNSFFFFKLTSFLYSHFSGNREQTLKVLEELGYAQPNDEDIEILQKICQVISERAARLAAAGLAALVKVCMVHNIILLESNRKT